MSVLTPSRRRGAGRGRSLASIAVLAVLSSLVLSACGNGAIVIPKDGFATDKSQPATEHWFTAHTTVISALGNRPAFSLAANPDYSELSAECVSFEDTYIAAKQLPAIPDSQAQQLWTDALTNFRNAVSDCEGGVLHKNIPLFKDANSELSAGGSTISLLIFGKKHL
jgi:hypothetical protein